MPTNQYSSAFLLAGHMESSAETVSARSTTRVSTIQGRVAFLVTFHKKYLLHLVRIDVRLGYFLARESDRMAAEIGGTQPHQDLAVGGGARIATFFGAVVSALQLRTAVLFAVSAGRLVSALDVDGVATLRNRLPHVDFTQTLSIFITQVTRKNQ